jgi:hypothetical protein
VDTRCLPAASNDAWLHTPQTHLVQPLLDKVARARRMPDFAVNTKLDQDQTIGCCSLQHPTNAMQHATNAMKRG